MMLQLFLLLISCFTQVRADDLINMKTEKVYKVKECISNRNYYKVIPCYSQNDIFCNRKYIKSKFVCVKSRSCGLKQLQLMAKGVEGTKVEKFDKKLKVSIPSSNLNLELGFGVDNSLVVKRDFKIEVQEKKKMDKELLFFNEISKCP